MPVISRATDGDQIGDRRGVTFADQVPAASTERLKFRVPRDATVERLSVRIYSGAELDLQIDPLVQHAGDEGTTSMIQSVGKQTIDGDDDVYQWDMSLPVRGDDTIVIKAANNDGSNAYDYRVNVELDYAGGLSRLWEVFR